MTYLIGFLLLCAILNWIAMHRAPFGCETPEHGFRECGKCHGCDQ
jgi:hypothetical protein